MDVIHNLLRPNTDLCVLSPKGSVFSVDRLHESRNQRVEEKLTLLTITLSGSVCGISAPLMHNNRLCEAKDLFSKGEIFLPEAQQSPIKH